jgi:hypothetical protein
MAVMKMRASSRPAHEINRLAGIYELLIGYRLERTGAPSGGEQRTSALHILKAAKAPSGRLLAAKGVRARISDRLDVHDDDVQHGFLGIEVAVTVRDIGVK